jgi:hypothetical protein
LGEPGLGGNAGHRFPLFGSDIDIQIQAHKGPKHTRKLRTLTTVLRPQFRG